MAKNPSPSQLDPGQIIKRSFDEGNDRIRVDANITAPDGQSILIDATSDSIKIGNTATGPFLNVNNDGSINVSGTVSSSNASIGSNGASAPTSSTEIGGKDPSNNLQSIHLDSSGNLLVNSIGTSTVSGTVNTNLNGLASFQTSQYTIGTSATQLTVTPLANRSSISIKVITTSSTDFIYIGNDNTVTTSVGYIMLNCDSLQLDLKPTQAIWAIGTNSGQKVYVVEIGG